jgi:hypothetical protein
MGGIRKKTIGMKVGAIAVGVWLTAVVGMAHASVIDQAQLLVNAGFGLGAANNNSVAQQGVKAGVSGILVGFEFQTNDLGGVASQTFDVWVNVGPPLDPDSNDFDATVTMNSGDVGSFFFVDTSSAGISLVAGDEFSFGIVGLGASLSVGTGNPYADGAMYFDGNIQSSDFAFRTHMSVAAPEPTTTALLALGLLGAGFARRRKH